VHPSPQEANEPVIYSSIGGWLIVVAIGLLVSPVGILYFVFAEIIPGFRAVPLSEVSGSFKFYLGLNLGLNLLLFAYVIVAAVLFFQRRRIVPRLIISLYVLNLLFVLLDRFVFMTASGDQWMFGIVSGVVSALIWIPYFLISKRVRATFVV
jgi:hypothetical protein